MKNEVKIVVEYNDNGYLLYVANYPGAFARGKTKEEALSKIPMEILSYDARRNNTVIKSDFSVIVSV